MRNEKLLKEKLLEDPAYREAYKQASALKKELILTSKLLEGDAKLFDKGVLLTENKAYSTNNGSAYWDATFLMEDNYRALSFDYNFIKSGREDQMGIWIDNKSVYVIEGYLVAGEGMQKALRGIDLSGWEPGLHTITIALHSSGKEDTQLYVGNFSVSYYPD